MPRILSILSFFFFSKRNITWIIFPFLQIFKEANIFEWCVAVIIFKRYIVVIMTRWQEQKESRRERRVRKDKRRGRGEIVRKKCGAIFAQNWAKKLALDFGRAAGAGFDCRLPFCLELVSCPWWVEFFNPGPPGKWDFQETYQMSLVTLLSADQKRYPKSLNVLLEISSYSTH